jgi:hypothetical protein
VLGVRVYGFRVQGLRARALGPSLGLLVVGCVPEYESSLQLASKTSKRAEGQSRNTPTHLLMTLSHCCNLGEAQ